MVEGGTSCAADMVYHVLHTSSLNDLGAILPVVKLIPTPDANGRGVHHVLQT